MGELEEIDPPPSYELKYGDPWKIIAVETFKEIPTGETTELHDKDGTIIDVVSDTELKKVIEWRYYDMNGKRQSWGDYRKWGIENQKLSQFEWSYSWLPDGTEYYTYHGEAEVPEEQIYQDKNNADYVFGKIRFGTKEEALSFRDSLPDNSVLDKPYYTRRDERDNWTDIPTNKWLPGEPFIPYGYELGNDDIWRSPYTQEAYFQSPYARRPVFTGMSPWREDAPRTRLGTQYLGAPQSIVTGAGEFRSGAPQVLGIDPYWGASPSPRFVSPVGTMKSLKKKLTWPLKKKMRYILTHPSRSLHQVNEYQIERYGFPEESLGLWYTDRIDHETPNNLGLEDGDVNYSLHISIDGGKPVKYYENIYRSEGPGEHKKTAEVPMEAFFKTEEEAAHVGLKDDLKIWGIILGTPPVAAFGKYLIRNAILKYKYNARVNEDIKLYLEAERSGTLPLIEDFVENQVKKLNRGEKPFVSERLGNIERIKRFGLRAVTVPQSELIYNSNVEKLNWDRIPKGFDTFKKSKGKIIPDYFEKGQTKIDGVMQSYRPAGVHPAMHGWNIRLLDQEYIDWIKRNKWKYTELADLPETAGLTKAEYNAIIKYRESGKFFEAPWNPLPGTKGSPWLLMDDFQKSKDVLSVTGRASIGSSLKINPNVSLMGLLEAKARYEVGRGDVKYRKYFSLEPYRMIDWFNARGLKIRGFPDRIHINDFQPLSLHEPKNLPEWYKNNPGISAIDAPAEAGGYWLKVRGLSNIANYTSPYHRFIRGVRGALKLGSLTPYLEMVHPEKPWLNSGYGITSTGLVNTSTQEPLFTPKQIEAAFKVKPMEVYDPSKDKGVFGQRMAEPVLEIKKPVPPTIETVARYDVKMLRANPEKIYLFGDNLEGKGKGGQAIIRGEPNAHGIPTKKKPSMGADAFFTDTELEANKKAIDRAIKNIPEGKTIVFPEDGLGSGRAQLNSRAPLTHAYLNEKLTEYTRAEMPPPSTKKPVPSTKPSIARNIGSRLYGGSPIKTPGTQVRTPPAQVGRYGFTLPEKAPIPTGYRDYDHLVRYLTGEEQRRRMLFRQPVLSEMPPTRPGLTGTPPARMHWRQTEPYASGRLGPLGTSVDLERIAADRTDAIAAEAERKYDWYKKQASELLKEKDLKEYFREEISKPLKEMSYKELKAEANIRGLKSTGKGVTKEKLINLIKEHMLRRDLTSGDYKKIDRLMSIAIKEKGLENVVLATFEDVDISGQRKEPTLGATEGERGYRQRIPSEADILGEKIKPTAARFEPRPDIAPGGGRAERVPLPKPKAPFISLSRDTRRLGRMLDTDKALRLSRQGLSPWEVAGELGINRPPPDMGRASRGFPLPSHSFTMTPETDPRYFPERRGRYGMGRGIPWTRTDYRMPAREQPRPYDMFEAPDKVTVSTNMDVIVETTPTEPALEVLRKIPEASAEEVKAELNAYADGKLSRTIEVKGKPVKLWNVWALRWNNDFFSKTGSPFKNRSEYFEWRQTYERVFKKIREFLVEKEGYDPGMAEDEAYKRAFREKLEMRRFNYYRIYFDMGAHYKRYVKYAKENKIEVLKKLEFMEYVDEGHERQSRDYKATRTRPATEARRFERIVGRPIGQAALDAARTKAPPRPPPPARPPSVQKPTAKPKIRAAVERATEQVQRSSKPKPYVPFQSRHRPPLGRFQSPVEAGVAWAAKTRPGRALGWLMSEGTMRRPGGARGILAPLSGGFAAPTLMGINPGEPGYRTAAAGGAVAGYALPMPTFGAAIGQHEYAPFFEAAGLNERQAGLAGGLAGAASMFNPVSAAVTFTKPIVTPVVEHVMAPWMARNIPQIIQRRIPRKGIY